MKTRKIISFISAAYGVLAAIVLEGTITPADDNWQRFSYILAFSAVGILRAYLYYEGATLREVGQKTASIAFRWSVVLTLAFIGYAVLLFIRGYANDYELMLFIMLTGSLAVTEWVFSQRIGLSSMPRLRLIESQSGRLLRISRTYQGLIKEFRKRIGSLESEAIALRLQIEEQSTKIETLSIDSRIIRQLQSEHIRFGNAVFGVCTKCRTINAYGIAAKSPVCKSCRSTLIK